MADDGGHDEPLSRQSGRPEPTRPAPRPAQPNEPGRGLHAELTPHHVQLVPGESHVASLTVRNLGTVVDELRLTVTGDAAAWTRIAPDSLNIYPGTEGRATIRFAPPRASRPQAGLLEFDVAITSTSRPEASIVYSTSLEVAAFDNLTAAAEGPTLVSGKREAVMPISVRNMGNRPTTVSVQASELPGAAVFLSSATVAVQPGGEATVWATVRPNRQILFGAPVIHPFTIYVSSDYSAPMTIDGRMEQQARFSRRRLGLAALLGAGALALAVGLAVVGSGLLGGAPAPSASASPTLGAFVTPGPSQTGSPVPASATPSVTQSILVTGSPITTATAAPTPPPPLTPAPPPTPQFTTGPTPTRVPPPPTVPPFTFAGAHAWTLESATTHLSFEPNLAGTLLVDENQGRAFWFFFDRGSGGIPIACEGVLDTANTPNILPDRTAQWLGFDDAGVSEMTRHLCGLQLQPPDPALPFAWAVSAKPGATATADRFVTFDPTTNTVFTWKPIGVGEFIFCALEHEPCVYTGSGRVSYGASGERTTKDFFDGMLCENASFAEGADPLFENGDPQVGVFKYCAYLPLDSL